MKHMPSVKSAMTPFPYSIDQGAPASEAVEFMRKYRVRHLPVAKDGELVGLITDRDLKLVLGPDFAYPSADRLSVGEAMVADAYSVDLNTPLDSVLAHMAEYHIGSAIVTRKGKLAGMFTSTDACRAYAEHLRKQFQPPGGNAAA